MLELFDKFRQLQNHHKINESHILFDIKKLNFSILDILKYLCHLLKINVFKYIIILYYIYIK